MTNRIKQALSYIWPIVIEKTSSRHNPTLEVALWKGALVLNARNTNYSFGALHRVFQNTFRHIKLDTKMLSNVLILGFGTGSVAQILSEDYRYSGKITGVEIDEKVIALGKQYFSVERYKNLALLNEDAASFVENNKTNYDLIVVDVFIDTNVPKIFMTEPFLKILRTRLTVPGGLLVFNTISANHGQKKIIAGLKETICTVFSEATVFKTMGVNQVVIAQY